MYNQNNKNFCVYIHINKINNKVYVGQTCTIPEKRWGKNGEGYKGCIKFYRAIQKYGWDNFTHEILFDKLTQEEANQKEKELIEFHHATDCKYGYNIRLGGSNMVGQDNPFYGKTHSVEFKEKQSKYAKEHHKGENNPNYGNHKLAGGNNPWAKRIKQYTLMVSL